MTNKKGLNAEELADAIAEARIKTDLRNYEAFRNKCFQNISKMAADLDSEVVVELAEEDLSALTKVTEELRDMNYKFRFIEVEDSSGNFKANKLLISIAHLLGA